jgi:hypothetical protein
MAGLSSNGDCSLCNATLTKSAMTKHLKSCMEKSMSAGGSREKGNKQSFFHLVVEGHGLPEYWMHLKVSGAATLKDLDLFLRKTWLECCGHMSAFRMGKNEISMGRKIRDVFYPGMKLLHEYDFGSTTEILLKVISEFEDNPGKEKIQVLARNNPPDIRCVKCDDPATLVCTVCIHDGLGWFCYDCAEEHECGEEMLLTMANSPRTGVCAYEG